MLEKVSFLFDKNLLLQRKCLFYNTLPSGQRFFRNHRKVIKVNSKLCPNPNLSFPLISKNKLRRLKFHTTELFASNMHTKYSSKSSICSSQIGNMPDYRTVNAEKCFQTYKNSKSTTIPPSCGSMLLKQNPNVPLLYNNSTLIANIYKFFSSLTTPDDCKKPAHAITSPTNERFLTTTPDDCKKPDLAVTSSTNERFYLAPKNVLHNAFDIVTKELENKDFKLQPTYNIVKGNKGKNSWCCTYNIKWPEQMKFVAVGLTKQDASHKAALAALLWLKKNEKITKDGFPIVVNKNQLKEITKQTLPVLNLDSSTTDRMNTITEIYRNEFVPALEASIDKTSKQTLNLDDIEGTGTNANRNIRKRVFEAAKYSAKEKIALPISPYKEEFIKLLGENRVVIIKGEPGCGKSTRIPQYVLEQWAREGLKQGEPCQIAVTQPRRIAAISLADRVSDERNENCGQIVGYQIRLKADYNPTTGRILYCTTGILLKYLQSDINLSNFTHVILDEAHERDVNTDLLMNLLKSALETNHKIKLIIMSATIDVELFKNYFKDPSVMHIPGFTHPVKAHFLEDLPIKLTANYRDLDSFEIPNVGHEDVVKVIKYIHKTKREGAILCFLPGWEDITKIEKLIPKSNDMAVLCLHSRLQDSDQRKIFSRTPPGIRKVILSTNIAETSVTIDDVVYVIDTGIQKENRFDNEKGVTCIDNYWISQSSMAQRKGRAGRVQPGESFHLYPKSKFDSFAKFTDPEILKTSLTKIVLNSKVYSNNMDALEFMSQLPTPPEKNATRRAVRELKDLKLVDESENLTSLGRTLANFQLEPKLAKILVNSVVYKCVTPVVDIVTLFSSDSEIFSRGLVDKEGVKRVKSQGSKHSDHLAMMRLFEAWLELLEDQGETTAVQYCMDANLVHYKLITINKLRKIHFDYLRNGLHDALPLADNYSDNDELVKAILFSGVGSLLRHRNWDLVKGRYKRSNVFLTNYNQKATITSESVNFKKTSFPSNFLVYFNEIRSNIRRTTLVRETTVISPIAVLLFSDKDLVLRDAMDESDKVILSLKDTKVEFCCSRETAAQVQRCKEALDSAYQYFIFQMTEGGECNYEINEIWDQILKQLNKILLIHSIK